MVRIKVRYILGELIFDPNGTVVDCSLDQKHVQDALKAAIQELHGDLGYA